MRELSLNLLDIAQNSIAAGANLITLEIAENTVSNELTMSVSDNGCGMTSEQLESVLDPFFTTRTTRKVGMGIPLFKMAAEQTGGWLKIESRINEGTTTTALFRTDSIDFTPLGDVTSTVTILISMNTDRDFIYRRSRDSQSFELSTVELKEILEGVPLSEPEVVQWMKDYINEQTNILLGGVK